MTTARQATMRRQALPRAESVFAGTKLAVMLPVDGSLAEDYEEGAERATRASCQRDVCLVGEAAEGTLAAEFVHHHRAVILRGNGDYLLILDRAVDRQALGPAQRYRIFEDNRRSRGFMLARLGKYRHEGTGLRIDHRLAVAVIRGNQEPRTGALGDGKHAGQALIHGFDGLDRSRKRAAMPHHIAVRVVAENEIVAPFADRLAQHIGDTRLREVEFVLYDKETFETYVEELSTVFLGDLDHPEDALVPTRDVALEPTLELSSLTRTVGE